MAGFRSLAIWSRIDPHLLLFIFLPALIYEGASDTNFYAFSNHFWSALVRASARTEYAEHSVAAQACASRCLIERFEDRGPGLRIGGGVFDDGSVEGVFGDGSVVGVSDDALCFACLIIEYGVRV